MEGRNVFFFIASILLIVTPSSVTSRSSPADAAGLKTYIVHVQPTSDVVLTSYDEKEAWYKTFLPKTSSDGLGDTSRLVFAYSEVFSGFAARLSSAELEVVAKKPGFVRAFPEVMVPLATTHTPEFLGLQQGRGLWNSSQLGRGVIIGMLDSGINPAHPSFADDGLPAPSSKWKGSCGFDKCNNKVIGGKSFIEPGTAPLDEGGHGTHTASTAAGNFVDNANLLGQARGIASGVAPHAHLAIYKVCAIKKCSSAAILAGLDAGVKDGVDILSLSLGGVAVPFHEDPIAIGTFAAVEKGIFVSCAGGNEGPADSTISNTAPWILTVAASTHDRRFSAKVTLGDNTEIDGQSLFQSKNFSSEPISLVQSFTSCLSVGSEVKGKIVLCAFSILAPKPAIAQAINRAGGVGVIIYNSEVMNSTFQANTPYDFPVAEVSYRDGQTILSYIKSAGSNATAAITFKGTVTGASPAPVVAYFSSRGPNSVSPKILKPDVTGPGLDILAAWPFAINNGGDSSTGGNGGVHFNVISGTSMSTPHLSGVAALLKSVHPDWSAAAIKSAIVTSSDPEDNTGAPIKDQKFSTASFYAKGAGHVNPTKAANPGLVFDAEIDDYIAYLCNLYSDKEVASIVGRARSCTSGKKIDESQLNYPSIVVKSGGDKVNRTATNVGAAASSYTVQVDAPSSLLVTVSPMTIKFSNKGEKQSFIVTINGRSGSQAYLKLVSDDKKQMVRIPIVVAAADK